MSGSKDGKHSGPWSWTSDVKHGVEGFRERFGDRDLVTELTSFTKFQQRVDKLITDLKGSDAGPGKVGQEPLTRNQFGGGHDGWVEAAGLFSTYQTVITELEKLSKVLSDSIEGMGIAVQASHNGYAELDVSVRDRMAAISKETTEHYGGAYDPTAPHGAEKSSDSSGKGQQDQASSGEDSGVKA